jgi:hypothetical protein
VKVCSRRPHAAWLSGCGVLVSLSGRPVRQSRRSINPANAFNQRHALRTAACRSIRPDTLFFLSSALAAATPYWIRRRYVFLAPVHKYYYIAVTSPRRRREKIRSSPPKCVPPPPPPPQPRFSRIRRVHWLIHADRTHLH